MEEEHPDTIDVNVRSTLDQDRLNKTNMQTKNFNKNGLNHKGANDCYVLGRKNTSTDAWETIWLPKLRRVMRPDMDLSAAAGHQNQTENMKI